MAKLSQGILNRVGCVMSVRQLPVVDRCQLLNSQVNDSNIQPPYYPQLAMDELE
jgi:hypothetical protein